MWHQAVLHSSTECVGGRRRGWIGKFGGRVELVRSYGCDGGNHNVLTLGNVMRIVSSRPVSEKNKIQDEMII